MDVALRVRECQRVERLRDNRDAVFKTEPSALTLGEFACIAPFDKLRDEIDDAIVRSAIDELDDVLVFECGGDVDLAHEAAHRFVADGKLRQQRFDRDSASSPLLSTEHHRTHATAA